MDIQHVGVIGCGLMGSGIVQVAVQAGFSVTVVEASDDLLKAGLGRLRQGLQTLVERGRLETAARDAALARVKGTTRLEDLAGVQVVVEAMTENQPLKNETFTRLDRICPPPAILASNTSSCNVTPLPRATTSP